MVVWIQIRGQSVYFTKEKRNTENQLNKANMKHMNGAIEQDEGEAQEEIEQDELSED